MFEVIKASVQTQFGVLSRSTLFVVKMEKDELFQAYLAALPEEERQPHNCNCCKTFLNNYGHIVSIEDNVIRTMWDFNIAGLYEDVPSVLRDLVMSRAIEAPFLNTFEQLGTDFNHQRKEDGEVIRWTHFMVKLPKQMVVRSKDSIEKILGDLAATKAVFERSLKEFSIADVETVLELIEQNTLYRGKEFEETLRNFLTHQKAYAKIKNKAKDLYVWNNFREGGRIRNTAIGTILIDLAKGKDLEYAVRAFEKKVAPANFKRPTALVTESMVKKMQAEIVESGFEPSLHRRHATPDDIPVGNLLYVNRDSNNKKLSVFDELKAGATVDPKSFARAKTISLDDFIGMLPTATSLEVLLQASSNFMSLIAPVDEDAPTMFAWKNGISWTYQNNLSDVVKEKVKAAGGSVDGELRISLEWFNLDDLDLHVFEPNENHIYFRDKRSQYSGGFLDVDMNAGSGTTRTPVENITFEKQQRMQEGKYVVIVHNFNKRENTDFGFNVQIECQGQVINFNYPGAVADKSEVLVAEFRYSKVDGITSLKSDLAEAYSQREVCGLTTNRFQPVSMAMWSPNYWGKKGVGNQHLFFILKNARIDNALRPFLNEYLSPKLEEHRKALEVLGSKLMVKPADQQLSGIGFSLTQRNQVIVRVNSTVYKIDL